MIQMQTATLIGIVFILIALLGGVLKIIIMQTSLQKDVGEHQRLLAANDQAHKAITQTAEQLHQEAIRERAAHLSRFVSIETCMERRAASEKLIETHLASIHKQLEAMNGTLSSLCVHQV